MPKTLIVDFLLALLIAAVLSYLFSLRRPRKQRSTSVFGVFMLLFVATWAGGIWMIPVGPDVLGVHWLPFLLVGLVAAVMMSSSHERPYPRGRRETLDMLETVERGKTFQKWFSAPLKALFWAVLFLLIAAVAYRYFLKI